MSNLTTVVNNIVSKVNTHTTDLSNKATQISTHIPLSSIAPYHLLQGNLAVSASAITQGFNTTLYTSGSATTGIDMDTQWGNTAEEKFGGLVWLKDRVEATNNFLYDTVRGATKEINSNTTEAEATLASGLTAFNSTGFTVGADTGHNSTTNNMVSWNFQTTHRVTGTTNHGKAYTCHYNPYTGFTIIKYEGSGLAGHEIPHHLGRKLGFVTFKNLSTTSDWFSTYISGDNYLYLNLTTASQYSGYVMLGDIKMSLPNNSVSYNASTNQYIMYGWANSYFDESNKLIGNYEIGVCQGTGAAGNKVTTRGKPAWIKIKRLDAANDWQNHDNQRNSNYILQPNTNSGENTGAGNEIAYLADGFNVNGTGTGINASGGQYLYLVAYDTNSNGGGSYYPLASDTANLQVNNALIPIAQGIDSNGAKNTILSKNETITGLTYTQGKNYVYYDVLGNKGVSAHKPRYLDSELIRSYAGENPDYFNVKENKWYSTNSGSELITNGTFDTDTAWTKDTGWTISGGRANYSYTNGSSITQIITTVTGKIYKISLNCAVTSGSGVLYINGTSVLSIATSKTYEYIFTATSTSTTIAIAYAGNSVGSVDNVSLFESVVTPTTEIVNGRNYLNHIVYADNDGGVLYVEELPKVEYKDTVQVDSLKILSGFDLGQTWKDVTASRSAGVTYTNNTGKPIQVMITTAATDTSPYVFSATVNGVQISYVLNNYTIPYWCFIVPQGHTYSVTSGKALSKWSELR